MEIPQIDVDTLAERRARGATIIDVRNPDEYVAGHVPGARLIPLPEVAERIAEVPEGEPVYLICAAGGRSQRAAELLVQHGRDVTNVAGGTNGWIQAGHPVSAGDQP